MNDPAQSWRLDSLIVHAGMLEGLEGLEGLGESRALVPPISQAAVFRFPDAESAAAVHEGEVPGFFYGRMGTPTQSVLERATCELERGEAALATASGMSAMTLALLSALDRGGHLIVQESLYTSTWELLNGLIRRLGVQVTRVDATKPGAIAEAVRAQTSAVLLETPSNPLLGLADIADARRQLGGSKAVLIVDSTFATPYNQRPLELGADLVVHSASKYLGGHGDLVAGLMVGQRKLVERARWKFLKVLGPVVAPLHAWLVLRGLRTLAVRMQRHNQSALHLAQFLEQHPRVSRVHYPGLASHPQSELARSQMRGFGGVLSFEVDGGAKAARRVVDRVQLCARAASLGDVVTLIQHCESLTQAALGAEERARMGLEESLIRLSVGLEDARDLTADLDRALG